jgi:hypothetical protein
MANVHSVQLVGRKGLNGTNNTPGLAGYSLVMTGLDVYYGGSVTAQQVFMRGAASQTIWFNNFAGASGQYASWRGRYALLFGQVLTIVTTDAMDVSLFAYQLLLP